MPYIQLERRQYPLGVGETLIGSGADAQVRIGGQEIERVSAVLATAPDGGVVIRRAASGAALRLNGVELGAEPSPLIHGDKIDVLGRELFFGDDRKAGNTVLINSVRPPASVDGPGASVSALAAGRLATRGRLVSLVDGREYPVPADGLVIGRDPTCDVVVPSTEVSRKHAVIALGVNGYMVMDTSTNGILVNGQPIVTSRTLLRGDVVRVAAEEFRFYSEPVAEGPASGAPARPAGEQPQMARLEVLTEGAPKGRGFDVRAPLAQAGRGEHNDIVIPDGSVSESHAKFQRRSTGWVVVDMNSTNGTYVGGKRIAGEQALSGECDVRLGNVKLHFRALDTALAGEGPGGGTRVIAPVKAPRPGDAGGREGQRSAAAESSEEITVAHRTLGSRSTSGILWIAIVVLVAVVTIFVLMSR
ncbi:MAG: FHA domain-containing protein [Gemmatimonadaceae bacterium]